MNMIGRAGPGEDSSSSLWPSMPVPRCCPHLGPLGQWVCRGGINAAIEQTSPRHSRGFPPLRNGPPLHCVKNVVFKCLYNIS